jgi:hypothetical protein
MFGNRKTLLGLATTVCILLTGFIAQYGETSVRLSSQSDISKTCGKCHGEIYTHWKNAMHSMSIEDPIFMASYMEAYMNTKGEAKYECLPCHAPITQINGDYDLNEEATREGVSCNFCHSIKGLNAGDTSHPFIFETGNIKRGPLSSTSTSAHGTAPSALFKSSELCAGCHEYTNKNGVKVLGTYSEWKESLYAKKGTQCQNCHMPLIPGRVINEKRGEASQKNINLHAISAAHSTEQLQKAVTVEIKDLHQEDNFIHIVVEVTNSGSGHMVPTGIPNRKLILWAELRTPTEVTSQQRVYERILIDEQDMPLKKICNLFQNAAKVTLDTRLRPGEKRTESFVFARPKNKEITLIARMEYLFKADVLSPTEMKVKMAETVREIR